MLEIISETEFNQLKNTLTNCVTTCSFDYNSAKLAPLKRVERLMQDGQVVAIKEMWPDMVTCHVERALVS